MSIHWLLQSLDDCPEILNPEIVPGWLSATEQQRLSTLKVDKRRRDWLLGRWTAKRLLQSYLQQTHTGETPLAAITIGNDEDGAPYGMTQARLPVSLAVSHSHGHALCAVVASSQAGAQRTTQTMLGCDLEYIETREPSFVRGFFTEEEMAAFAATTHPDELVTAIWSAKESVLKAIRTGLRVDTRRITCRIEPGQSPQTWMPLEVSLEPNLAKEHPGSWSAWWRVSGEFVLTMALHEQAERSASVNLDLP